MRVKAKCAYCGSSFERRTTLGTHKPRKIYCCAECCALAQKRNKPITGDCLQCGNPITGKTFCSRVCKAKYQRREAYKNLGIAPGCGHHYLEPGPSKRQFCGWRCACEARGNKLRRDPLIVRTGRIRWEIARETGADKNSIPEDLLVAVNCLRQIKRYIKQHP